MNHRLLSKVVKDELIKIEQSAEVRQLLGGQSKSITMPIWVNIFGDSSLDKIAASNGNIMAAMSHILTILPDPKIVWLQALAMATSMKELGDIRKTAKYLGISKTRFYDPRSGFGWPDKIRAITDGKIELGAKAEDPGELPGET